MTTTAKWLNRPRIILALTQRDFFSTLISPGIYLVTALGSFASGIVLVNSLNYIQENGLVVFDNPLAFSMQIFVTVLTLYLGVVAAASVTREREAGYLESLFYSPVDETSFILAKFFSFVLSFAVAALLFTVNMLLFRALTNFHLPSNFLIVLMLALVAAANLIAGGIFVSSALKTSRGATLAFIGIILVFLAVQLGYSYVFSLSPARYYDAFALLKQFLTFLNQATEFLSPFSYFSKGTEAIQNGKSVEFIGILGRSILFTITLVVLSINRLVKSGVRK